jgi:hypothetical protein
MRNLWVKIGLSAAGIFAAGMVVVLLGRFGKAKIEDLVHSDSDIRIPLMGIVPFQLADQRLGDLRRLTLLRDAPDHLRGVRVEARLGDSITVDALKDCTYLTVSDPEHLNERTRFTCLADSAGFASFGTVEVRHRQDGEATTLVRTLLLPPDVMQALQESMGPRVTPDAAQLQGLAGMADSIRAATQIQVEIAEGQARAARSARVQRGEVRDLPTPPAAPGAESAPAPKP